MTERFSALTVAAMVLCGACGAVAGTLDAPAPPSEAGSAMYTSGDLYNRLANGAAGTKRTGPFAEPTALPSPTGHTIDEIMSIMPQADNLNGATTANVIAGKTFWGLRTDGSWGPRTGTLPPQTLNPASNSVPAGYYSATSLNTVDIDLTTANIRAGVTIFGVIGSPNLVNTTESTSPATAGQILAGRKAFVNGVALTGTINAGANVTGADGARVFPIPDGLYTGGETATATDANLISDNIRSGVTIFGVTSSAPPTPLPRTGQTSCYDIAGTLIECAGTGQDGAWQKGIAPPSPRFTDNNDGTMKDNATGLIWLKNANCFGKVNWGIALSSANNLANGSCGLTDGSSPGQWRLPNIMELQSLVDFGRSAPALPADYTFINLQYTSDQTSDFWSSTSSLYNKSYAWMIDFYYGARSYVAKNGSYYYVWPVRGGQ